MHVNVLLMHPVGCLATVQGTYAWCTFVEAQLQPMVFASSGSLDALLQHDYSQRACGEG